MNRVEAMRVIAAAEADRDGNAETAAALDALDPEIEPAFRWLMKNEPAGALRLVAALETHFENSGQVDLGRRLTDEAVDAFLITAVRDEAVAAAIPRALLAASELAFRQGDQEQAEKRAHACIRAAMLIEDTETAALAHINLSRVAYRGGDAAAMEAHARKAMELAPRDEVVHRGALHMLAWAAHTAGDLDEAERRFRESLEYRRKHGTRLSVAVEIANLGDLAAERGQLSKAARLMADSLEVSVEVGSQYMLVNAFPSFAVLAEQAGFDDDSARLVGAGRAISATAGLIPDPNSLLDEAVERTRDRLGEVRFAELLAEGTMLSTDAAVDLARAVSARIAAASE